MTKNPLKDINSYELIENNAGELMITLYANSTLPSKPSFYVDEENHSIELTRNPEDTVILDSLADESIEKIKNLKDIYVCELKYDQAKSEDDDFEIEYAYVATHKKKVQETPKPETLQEKLQKTREKILEKRNQDNTTSDSDK